MKKYFFCIFFAGVLLASPISGANNIRAKHENIKREWYFPDAIKFQYSGNIGNFAGGIAYDICRWYQLGFLYGTVWNHNEVKILNTICFENTFLLSKFHLKNFTIIPTVGISINSGSTHNTFHKLPDYFPDGYYFQNKIHFAPSFGTTIYHPLPFRKITGIGFYYKISTLDNYLLEGIRTEYVKLNEIWNLGIGITLHF